MPRSITLSGKKILQVGFLQRASNLTDAPGTMAWYYFADYVLIDSNGNEYYHRHLEEIVPAGQQAAVQSRYDAISARIDQIEGL